MNIETLKRNIKTVMPILDANLHAAHDEYLSGKIPAGAFRYVRSRHEVACAVLQRDDISPFDAFKACAILALDLRSGVKDLKEKAQAEADVDAWWKCFREAGFTEINPFFKIPSMPAGVTIGNAERENPENEKLKALVAALPKSALITHITPQRGNVMESEQPEIEVFEGKRRLSVKITASQLMLLIDAGIFREESSSGDDPNLYYRYDHYVPT